MSTGCILMAAGSASRFGAGNKLLSDFDGLPVYIRAMNAIPAERFSSIAIVSGEAEILSAASERGFIPVVNREPALGASRSVKLGMQALPDTDRLLFMVADQPCLQAETVRALLELSAANPESICRLSCEGQHGNPVLFPRLYYPELLLLTGDRGGGAVCASHPEAVRYLEIDDKNELADIDSRSALEELRRSRAGMNKENK